MKAAILARVSRSEQKTESQINLLLRRAKEHGFEVPENYIFQEKITGLDRYDKEERISLQELKAAIINNKDIQAVYLIDLTRLSRNPYYLIDQLNWFNENRVPIYIDDARKWTRDLETGLENSDTTSYIFGAATYGKNEIQKIKDRTTRGRDEKAQRGLFVGHISDGYKVELRGGEKYIIIDENRVNLIKEIFNLYTISKLSTNQIAAFLNERKVPPFNAYEAEIKKNNPNFNQYYKAKGTSKIKKKSLQKWTGSTIGQLLRNRWYIGERYYKGIKYDVPNIIEEEQFNQAVLLLDSNKTLPKNRKSIYLLSNLLYCGKCGEKMLGHKVRINSSYYCSSLETGKKCGLEGICKQNIEAIVWAMTIQAVKKNPFKSNENKTNLFNFFKISDDEIENLKQQIIQNQESIHLKEHNIDVLRKDLKAYYKEKIKAKTKSEKEAISTNIQESSTDIIKMEKEILHFQSLNIMLQNQIDNNNEVESVMEKIDSINDLLTMKDILSKIVKKVTLYNLKEYDKLISIEYISGQTGYALYNSRKLKGYYIPLFGITWDEITFDSDAQTFINQGKHIISSTKGAGIYQTNHDDNLEDELKAVKLLYGNNFKIYDKPIFDSTEIREIYINFKQEIIRVESEPTDQEYKQWKVDYQKWSITRNERKKEQRKLKKNNQER